MPGSSICHILDSSRDAPHAFFSIPDYRRHICRISFGGELFYHGKGRLVEKKAIKTVRILSRAAFYGVKRT